MLIRDGWYFLTTNMPVPVGNNTLYYRQKIHSTHPDFKKIDPKYFTMGGLKHESLVNIRERNIYFEMKSEVPFYVEKDGETYIKEKGTITYKDDSEPKVVKTKVKKPKKVVKKPKVEKSKKVIEDTIVSEIPILEEEKIVEEKSKKTRKPRTKKVKKEDK